MIEIKNIEKSFGESKVLKGVSTIFETGKTNLIIGQSGSGKTVLLKSLLGIHLPEVGVISFDGRIYSNLSAEDKRELRTEIGMVFQGSALFDSMTVEENVGFPLKMFTNNSKSEIQDRVNFVLKRVNLVDANSKFPAEISGGMQKRVAIARALASNPQIVFFDEPTSGLDPLTSEKISQLIKNCDEKITKISIMHDIKSALAIATRIVFLKDGLINWIGTPEDLKTTQNTDILDFVNSGV